MDERVRSGPDQLVDQLYSEYIQMLDNNPIAQLRRELTPKSLADIAGLFSRKATSLASAAVANPQSPTETGFSGIKEPLLEFNKRQEMRDRLVEEERRAAPRANNMGGFIGQMYGDDYNIGNAYGN